MLKSKKTSAVLGACAAAVGLSVSVPQAHAAPLPVTVQADVLTSVSIQTAKGGGVVAIQAAVQRWSNEDGNDNFWYEPLILCPYARGDGQRTAYVHDLPEYRTLLDQLIANNGKGTLQIQQEADGRCFVTGYTFDN